MTKSFSDQFRAAVLNAEESRYKISKATGISESNLSRFVRGDSGLSMAFMDRLAEHLGLEVAVTSKLSAGPSTKRKSKPKSKGR